jgi:hypothetical protein
MDDRKVDYVGLALKVGLSSPSLGSAALSFACCSLTAMQEHATEGESWGLLVSMTRGEEVSARGALRVDGRHAHTSPLLPR